MTIQSNPFRLNNLPRYSAKPIEQLLGLEPLALKYDERPNHATPETFLDYTLNSLGCQVQFHGQDLTAELPEEGPTIVIANHPFGGIEGVALTRALLAIRPDTKVLTNQMLSKIPELAPIFFGVEVLKDNAVKQNTNSIKAASQHLADNGLLLVFPAGQVSAMTWKDLNVKDRTWNPMIGRLAKKYEATCVPIYVHGQNPLYFQLGGLLHRRVRTALLPRQLSNKAGQQLEMTVGAAIDPRDYRNLADGKSVTDMLRMATYLLKKKPIKPAKEIETVSHDTILNRQNDLLQAGLDSLEEYKLLSKSQFDVYCAPFHALTTVFDAIAIERELTFRAAGEGTGKEKDIDQFDPDYHHLFVWDREKHAIVGGYRLGETDRIVQEKGVNALYSRSLYRYDEAYLEKLGPALEVGRSFVTQAYQRHPAALDLLWRGIGHFVVKNPKYQILFGCVSISADHSEMARAFISDAMMESFRAEQKFLENVKPIMPLKVTGKAWSAQMLRSIKDISVFNKLVGQCDPGKTIPVLLRHYLALNGRFVGFSINKGFNDSLDGLILADLHKMPERYLTRYMGKEGLETYRRYWDKNEATV